MKKGKSKQKTFMDLHQPAAASVKDVVKAGYLMKEGGSYKSWKSRYFVVDGTSKTIYYYSKPKDKKPLGFIPLWDCRVEPNTERQFQNCFEVNHPDRRTFYMITTSAQELNEWVDTLRRVVREGTKLRKSKVTSFWEKSFGSELSVKWNRFCDALKAHVNDSFDRSTEDKVHFVLATLALKSQPKDEVHVGQLHLFTELLGQIGNAYRNLGEIVRWYHGALTSSDAENKLKGQPEGTFLLRLRRFAADSGLLALSLVGKKGIIHTNIYKEPIQDVYYTGFNEVVYSTVQDLIRAHPHCIKECDSQVARDYLKLFEAARLVPEPQPQPQEAQAPQKTEPKQVEQTSNANNNLQVGASAPDGMSPRVPMSVPASVATHEDLIEAYPTPPNERKNGPDGAGLNGDAIVTAISGETTFDSMHQPAARDVPDVIHSGWLIRELEVDDEEMEGGVVGEQQRAYFVLSGQLKTLYYFGDPNDDEPLGFVPLWGCDISETQDAPAEGCFEISHPDRLSFFIQARDEAEMNDWANALLTVIDEWKVEQARKRERFWREHFGTRKEVSWETFLSSLQLEVGELTQKQEYQLRFMIGTFAAKNQSPDTIKSRQLYLFIELFGALSQCYNQMDQVCLWYQGSLTSSDAQNRLKGQPEGTFLIRLRRFAADSGLLAMSFVQDGEPQHINIFRDPLSDYFYLFPSEPVFSSIEELVVGHAELHPLPEPGLGRAYREFLEKSGLVLDKEVDLEDSGESDDDEAALRLEKERIEQEEREREEYERRLLEEENERRRLEEEEEERERLRISAVMRERAAIEEEEERIRMEEEAARIRREEEEEAIRRQLEEEEAAAEAERIRRQQEEEEEAERFRREKKEAEERARREEAERKAEAERVRKQQEEAERLRKEKEAAEERARRAEAERNRLAIEAEQERLRLEEERLAREEAERQRQLEEQKKWERLERQRKAAEEAKREKERQARVLEEVRLEKERKAREAAERAEAERRAEEERLRKLREAEEKQRQLREEEERKYRERQEREKRRLEEEAARKRRAEEEERARQQRAKEELERKRQQQQQQQQHTQKTEQQLRVERQKALIEEERRKLEQERQAKLQRLAKERERSAPPGSTTAFPPTKQASHPGTAPKPSRASVNRGLPQPPAKAAATSKQQGVEAELEDPVNYSDAAAIQEFPEFAKETKVERLYKERMMQARGNSAPPGANGAPALPTKQGKGPATQEMGRQSNLIKLDVNQMKEVLQYLSKLEMDDKLTEDEVYELENLVTVKRDQMVLSYYMAFKENEVMFVKRCRRHLGNLKKG